MRILLDPAAGDGGGATTTTTADPTPTPTPTPTTTPAPAEAAQVRLNPDEYRALLDARSRLAEVEAEKRRELEQKEAERLAALAAKGQADEALRQLREAKDTEVRTATERAAAVEAERLAERKESAVAQALLGADFVSTDAADQARLILDGRFEAVRDAAGRIEVVEKSTRRPASDVIKEWLASPASAHFRKPSTTGGSGAKGGDQTTPTPGTGGDEKPMTVAEALIAREKARLANPNTAHYGLRAR